MTGGQRLLVTLTRSTALIPAFEGGAGKRRFLRHAQDTEFIEVQGQP
jgi:hypothetical protein